MIQRLGVDLQGDFDVGELLLQRAALQVGYWRVLIGSGGLVRHLHRGVFCGLRAPGGRQGVWDLGPSIHNQR